MLEGIPVAALGPSALLGIAILLLLTGRLVPKATLDAKNEEVRIWRETAEKEREGRATSDAQTRELLELAKTTNKIVEAIAVASGRVRESGEAHALPTTTD